MATIREIMTTNLITVEPTATVAEAATLMGQRHVGSVLVTDGETLAGIFTERDIVRALSQDFDAPRHQVEQWMTRGPKTVAPESTVEDALDLMLSGGFRHLPVMEEDRVVGMVSIRDLSRATAER
jgi:CBS domain-containing protein